MYDAVRRLVDMQAPNLVGACRPYPPCAATDKQLVQWRSAGRASPRCAPARSERPPPHPGPRSRAHRRRTGTSSGRRRLEHQDAFPHAHGSLPVCARRNVLHDGRCARESVYAAIQSEGMGGRAGMAVFVGLALEEPAEGDQICIFPESAAARGACVRRSLECAVEVTRPQGTASAREVEIIGCLASKIGLSCNCRDANCLRALERGGERAQTSI